MQKFNRNHQPTRSGGLAGVPVKQKKLKVGKPLPPAPQRKLKNRVLRQRARRPEVVALMRRAGEATDPAEQRALLDLADQAIHAA